MQHEFETITAELASPAPKGAAREEIVRRFLSGYMPHRFEVADGQVTDCFGNSSGQIDVLILDLEDTPVLYSAPGAKVFLCESVRGVVEVKSQLTKKGLLEDARKIKRLKGLRRVINEPVYSVVQDDEALEPNRACPPIIGGIFAYSSGQSLESLGNELKEWNTLVDPQERVDFLAVLDHGIVTFGEEEHAELFEANAHEGLELLGWPIGPPMVLLLVCTYILRRLTDFQLCFGRVPVASLGPYFAVAVRDLMDSR
jgi:hypothetical protein